VTSISKKSTSRFRALDLPPNRSGRWVTHMGFTSCPPKPRMGCTRGTISLPRCLSLLKQSQVIMLAELSVSIKIRCTRELATFSSTTRGSLCGKLKCWPSCSSNVAGMVMQFPCSAVRTCCVPHIWAFHAIWVMPSTYPPAIVSTIPVEHFASRGSSRAKSQSLRRDRGLLFRK